jgi:hypothetical protein
MGIVGAIEGMDVEEGSVFEEERGERGIGERDERVELKERRRRKRKTPPSIPIAYSTQLLRSRSAPLDSITIPGNDQRKVALGNDLNSGRQISSI